MTNEKRQRISQKIKETDNTAVACTLQLYLFLEEYGIGAQGENTIEEQNDEM